MSNKLCACGRNRKYVHFCDANSTIKKARRNRIREEQKQKWLMEEALKHSNNTINETPETKELYAGINGLIDCIESVNNFFKMRRIPFGRIALCLLTFIVIAIIVLLMSNGNAI